jgi:thiamine-phosphate pyrophosphorylase
MLAARPWQTEGMDELRERLSEARLYLVGAALPAPLLEAVLAAGVDIVQLRMKAADEDAVLRAAETTARICSAHGALFILNDRPDLAARAGADGVHLGQDDMPIAQARELLGARPLIGLSTHSPAQIQATAALAVDYIGVGPVHVTPTKPGRPAVGLELVGYAAAHAATPFFAIGGIDLGNVPAVRAAGAERIAVVRAVTEAGDPAGMARRLRAAITTEPRDEVEVGPAQS